MKTSTRLISLALILVCLMAFAIEITISIANRRGFEKQYQDFVVQERKVIPAFDTLNQSVYESLPKQENIEEIQQYSTGGGSLSHGRKLIIEYALLSIRSDEIVHFYDEFLVSTGWNLYHKFDDSQTIDHFYYKGTACLNFSARPDSDQFQIKIHHDFQSQDFSPVVPSAKVLNWNEVDGYIIYECPEDFSDFN